VSGVGSGDVPGLRQEVTAARQPLGILVLCTGNSARSQIAEALLATGGKGRVLATSAGSHPAARVNPYAIEVLRDHGIEWEDRVPKSIDDLTGRKFDLVITVCDNARDACPFFPGARAQVHWGMPDPAEHTQTDAARAAFLETYEGLERRVDDLLALPLEKLDPVALQERAQAVHELRGQST
jgi:arsenate reductase